MKIDYIGIIGIIVSLMAVCAVFITVTPLIDRLRDRRLTKLERRTKSLMNQIEKHEREIQIQKISLENIQNIYLNLLKSKQRKKQ
jgi:hypothetical protein